MNLEYLKFYNDPSYFLGSYGTYEQKCWDFNQLRYGDQIPAICYAFGYISFEQVRKLFGLEGEGKLGYPFIGAISQLEEIDGWGYGDLSRYPKSVLDIGGGRGEVVVGFSYWDKIKVQMIEPAACAPALLKMTQEKFGIWGKIQLWNKDLKTTQKLVDWSDIDTVIMTEAIEHIEEEDFNEAYQNYIKPTLIRNKGLLIITNWLLFHPIELMLPFHCRRVDNSFYDSLSADGRLIYREGSHLIIKYGG